MNYLIRLHESEITIEGVEAVSFDEEANAYDFLGENDELLAIIPIRSIESIVREEK